MQIPGPVQEVIINSHGRTNVPAHVWIEKPILMPPTFGQQDFRGFGWEPSALDRSNSVSRVGALGSLRQLLARQRLSGNLDFGFRKQPIVQVVAKDHGASAEADQDNVNTQD
jgi:hypothetical protein